MLRLQVVLDVAHDKLTKEEWDNVLIIGGDEGTGKSTLGLHILEYWLNKLYGKVKAEDIKYVALNLKQFLQGFKDLKRFEMEIYDEAGELSSLRMTNRFNYAIAKAYEVVRGECLFTILILPDVFYLNPFFSTRRARGYIHVYKRGRFAYWNKKKLRDLIERNKLYKKKSVWRISPLFYDTFPKYKGVMLEPYLEKKKKKMESVRDELYNKIIVEEEEKHDLLRYIANSYELIGSTKSAQIFECSARTILRKKDEYLEVKRKQERLSRKT